MAGVNERRALPQPVRLTAVDMVTTAAVDPGVPLSPRVAALGVDELRELCIAVARVGGLLARHDAAGRRSSPEAVLEWVRGRVS